MLTLYKSSSLNTLFGAWSDLISQPSPGGPLRPRPVIVPNMDMAQWLQVHQAERTGISANIDFQLPAGYFRKIFESGMSLGSGAGSAGTMFRSKFGAGLGTGTGSTAKTESGVESVAAKIGPGSGAASGAAAKQVQTQLLDKYQLRWMAFTLLGEALETGQYPREWGVLVEWIKSASQKEGGSRDMKGVRWDLAGQIADVFDQYIMYRPHWLREWAGGGRGVDADFVPSDHGSINSSGDGRKILGSTLTSIVGLEGMNAWQPTFWAMIRSRWGEYSNRADLMLGLVDELGGGDARNLTFPPQIVIFGVQSVAPILMEALLLKSKFTDVHWFQRDNESNGPFTDDFLSDLSTDQLDQSTLMSQLIDTYNLKVNTIHIDEDTPLSKSTPNSQVNSSFEPPNSLGISTSMTTEKVEKRSKTYLKAPDSSTFNPQKKNDNRASILTNFPKILAKPGAISIHRCHSPRREVEVLHDALLHLFETQKIRPGDVAIVTPDADLYAPFVREVFQAGSSDQVRIPIRISGGQLNERELVADVLLKALDITNSRFKATEILDWLGLAPVLGDFLDETGLRGTLNRWIEEQRIRWGSGQNHIKDIGFELDGRHSWMFGLQRILLARIASEDQDMIFDGQLSGSAITSANENILLGRLLSIISALDEFRIKSKSAHSMSEWSNLFHDLLDSIVVDANWIAKSDKIRSVLHGMKNLNDDLLTEELTLEIARDYLKLRLESGGLGRAWHPGFVTFTGMVALHQFPYKVVAMIGLNDGSLPGRTPVTAFDLLSKNHQPGDRIRRQADRQMFLDYLFTTEEILHISYTGLRQTDNKQVAPSVMVTALIDNLNRWSRKYDLMTPVQVEHRLQPFHSSYFDGSGVLKSFSKYYAEIAEKLQSQHKTRGSIIPELKPGQHLSLKELLGIDTGLSDDAASIRGDSDHRSADAGADHEGAVGTGTSMLGNGPGRLADHTSESNDTQVGNIQYSLSELIDFYNNPIKHTLRNGFGIDLFESDVPDEDVEPFDLNALDKWKIRTMFYQHLLDEIKKGGATRSFDSKMVQSMSTKLELEGILPDAIAGRKSLNFVINELTQIWSSIQSDDMMDFSSPLLSKMITQDVKFEKIVEVKVTGEINICANNVYFAIEAGSIKQKKILQQWIHHVLLNCESPIKSRIYFKDQKRIDFAELTVEEASIRLYNLLFIRVLSQRFLIPIFPECSVMYLNSVENGDESNAKNAIRRIIEATTGDPGKFASELITEMSTTWVGHAWAEQHPLTLSYTVKNLTPDQLGNSSDFIIKMGDFDEFDAFSVVSVKLFGLMKGDLI